MLYTSSYNNCKSDKAISISGDKGKKVGFNGDYYLKLAPKLSFWIQWHNNIDILSEQENNDYYILKYYEMVLSHLNPLEVYNELNNRIACCYEDPLEFCHRHIYAAWLETELEIVVPEVKIVDNKIIKIDKNEFIKNDYKRLILKK